MKKSSNGNKYDGKFIWPSPGKCPKIARFTFEWKFLLYSHTIHDIFYSLACWCYWFWIANIFRIINEILEQKKKVISSYNKKYFPAIVFHHHMFDDKNIQHEMTFLISTKRLWLHSNISKVIPWHEKLKYLLFPFN